MKKNRKQGCIILKFLLIYIVNFIFLAVNIGYAQTIPNKNEIISSLEVANKYFMQKYPDPSQKISAKGKLWQSHIWTRGIYYEGLMALYQIDKKPEYLVYMTDWGNAHNWSLNGGNKTRHADNQACGQTYIDLYQIEPDEKRIKAIKTSIDSMLATNKFDDWSWIDAIQMSMPIFARLGSIYKDSAYFNRMYEMYAYTKYKQGGNGLYNVGEHLWWRDKDFIPPYKTPEGFNCYWARGNGWVLAGLVRTLQYLPKSDVHYNDFLQDYKDMCEALLPLQRSDGCWNVSLQDPKDFGGKELTGTSLYVYGFSYGINNGLLPKRKYLPAVSRAWNTLTKECLHTNGFLGFVQGTGKEPKDGQPLGYDIAPDFDDFGLGCFLLAGSEIYKIIK